MVSVGKVVFVFGSWEGYVEESVKCGRWKFAVVLPGKQSFYNDYVTILCGKMIVK